MIINHIIMKQGNLYQAHLRLLMLKVRYIHALNKGFNNKVKWLIVKHQMINAALKLRPSG